MFIEAIMSIEADKEILLKLGGSTKVAELLGYRDKQRVQNWMKRGIPAKVKLEYPHLFLNPNIQSNNTAA